MSSPHERQGYHHGDLRRSFIETGLALVREVGIEALSLRQLAERVGVSTPALYHHFRNKQDLLHALGEASIAEFETALGPTLAPGHTLEDFVIAYVRFARDNPELYELMLGRSNWRGATQGEFHRLARHSFRVMGERLLPLQQGGQLAADINPLRLAQVAWATLHGLCRMYNDGLAFTPETVEDIARYAVRLMQQTVVQHEASRPA